MEEPFVAREISPDEYLAMLFRVCDCATSLDDAGWTRDNRLYAHCAVVSLVAQDLFGGTLLRATLEPYPEFAHMRSHYWNRLPDGREIDFTEAQFQGRKPALFGVERLRQDVLSPAYPNTVVRYKLLSCRITKARSSSPLFDDDIYQKCYVAALDSPCKKMKFGCVVVRNNEIVYEGNNHTIPELRSQCDSGCIRHSITSRTESMLGACGHAEEWALWKLVERKIPLSECELYIAGFYSDGYPWIKKTPEHTCMRCAVQMYHAHLANIYVPVADGWAQLSTEEALHTALLYATKEKTV